MATINYTTLELPMETLNKLKDAKYKLVVLNNNIGCYNLLNPSQKTFEFSIGLCEGDENKIVTVDGIKAKLVYSGEPEDKIYFENPFDNLEDIFRMCWEYANSVWSTVNYKEQCLLFAKLYQENYENIDNELVKIHKENVQKQIDELKKQLEWNTIIPDLGYIINKLIKEEIDKIKKSISIKEKKLS
jgi:hypothetical protein